MLVIFASVFWGGFAIAVHLVWRETNHWTLFGHIVDFATLVVTFVGALAIPWALWNATERRSAWIPQTLKDLEELHAALAQLSSEIAESAETAMTQEKLAEWGKTHRNQRTLLATVTGRAEAHAPGMDMLRENLRVLATILTELRSATLSSAPSGPNEPFAASPDQVDVAQRCRRKAGEVHKRLVAILC